MKNHIGYLYLVITCFIWGSIYIVSKYAMMAMGPLTLLGIRYLVAVVCLAFLLKVRGGRKPVRREDWKYIWIVGGLGYFVSIACQMVGTKLLDASLASLINSLNPVTISLFAAVFLKEKIQKKHVISILISLTGIYVILGVGDQGINPGGLLASICSVLFWSAASVSIRRISGGYDPVQVALYGMLVALIFAVPAGVAQYVMEPTVLTAPAVLSCIYLGMVGTGVAHTLWNSSLRLLDASVCSMFYPLQPLTSAVMGVLFLHEILTKNFIVGGILICLGVIVSVVEPGKRQAEA